MLALIGSHALLHHEFDVNPKDMDLVGSYDEVINFIKNKFKDSLVSIYPIHEGKKVVAKSSLYSPIEAEISWDDSLSKELLKIIQEDPQTFEKDELLIPSLDILYLLKMTHRYLKNSPHFLKTLDDCIMLKNAGASISEKYIDFFIQREKETYNYSHPKLNVNKETFFKGDGIQYIYDHDSIHEVMKQNIKPAYTYFKKEQSEVFCDKNLFYSQPDQIRLSAVLEESYVLALERSQIPYKDKNLSPRKSFNIALEKVCTSITSGWFREFAWNNYYQVAKLYDDNYVVKFWQAVEDGKVKLGK